MQSVLIFGRLVLIVHGKNPPLAVSVIEKAENKSVVRRGV